MVNQQKQPNSAQEWAQWAEGEVVQLSRFAVRIKPPDVLDMLMADGAVYEALAGMRQKGEVLSEDNFEKLSTQYPALKPFLDQLVLASFIDPRVIADGPYDLTNNEIPLAWVHTVDKLAVMGRLLGDFESLSSLFPGEQAGEMDAAQNRASLRAAALDLGGSDGAE